MASMLMVSLSRNNACQKMENKEIITTQGEDIESFLAKMLVRILNARVDLERLPDAVVNKYIAAKKSETSKLICEDANGDVERGLADLVRVIRCPKCYSAYRKSKSNYKCNNCKWPLVYCCKKCDEQFKTRSSVYYHLLKTCSPRGVYNCRKCDYKSILKRNVKIHLANVHSTKLVDIEKNVIHKV